MKTMRIEHSVSLLGKFAAEHDSVESNDHGDCGANSSAIPMKAALTLPYGLNCAPVVVAEVSVRAFR
jgi:hypothetical protein